MSLERETHNATIAQRANTTIGDGPLVAPSAQQDNISHPPGNSHAMHARQINGKANRDKRDATPQIAHQGRILLLPVVEQGKAVKIARLASL